MKKETRFALSVILLAVMAVAFADTAMAKPDWVTVKYTGVSLRKQEKTKPGDGNHLRLVLKFDIVNNSKKGDVMTAIYDRKISWNGAFTINKMEIGKTNQGPSSSWKDPDKPASWNVKYSMTGTEPYKGEWYPGQVYKYEHSVPLNKLIKPYDGNWQRTNEAAFKDFSFKFEKWSFDFQVQSHK
jgi:hypothetical protein